jgi:serine/threonine protein kinase/Tol biopolymer transport system component
MRLGRMVAIKVLPEALAGNAERTSRLEREARSASALSHAHVVSLFDVGRSGDYFYLVTEMIEGGNLREIMVRGPLPLRRSLELAAQIASGLAAAHEQGIVHRDLKPENVLIAKSGEAKIVDFGLAKLTETSDGSDSRLPTSDGLKTSEGVVMGTASYMSPEQARGAQVDFRSDQFAFGSLFYELLSGLPSFRRDSVAETLSAIMRDEPRSLRSIDAAIPPNVAWVVERCLAKEPGDRYASTRDLAKDLAFAREHLSDPAGPSLEAATERVRRLPGRVLPWVITAVALAAAAVMAVAVLRNRRGPALTPLIRFSIPPPENAKFFSRFDSVGFALSPDGSRLAFVGDRSRSARDIAAVSGGSTRIWVRALSELEGSPVAGTEGASSLFWSSDGRSVGFFVGGQLKRVDLGTGSPVPICDVPPLGNRVAGTWGTTEILFGSSFEGVIYRVPADGSQPAVPLVRPDRSRGESRVVWPHFLPGGKSFLYILVRSDGAGHLMLGSLDRHPPREVASISSRIEYVEPGFLVFARDGALFAQHFDTKTARLTGPLLSLAPAVYYFYTSKWAGFATSRGGTLAYQPQGNITRLTWFDRSGRALGDIGSEAAGETISLSISPDGRNALFDRTRPDLGTYDVWMIDLARAVETRLTSDPNTEFDPVWLPDGRHFIYSVVHDYLPQLVRREVSGGPEEPLLPPGTFQEALDVTADGRRLFFSQSGENGSWGIWELSLAGHAAPAPLVVTKSSQEIGRVSPDGKFIAFLSDQSGQLEAYVAAIEGHSEKVRLSTGGATLLRWSRDGKEIYYTSPDQRLFSVSVRTSPSFQIGAPVALFSLPAEGWRAFDVTADGRFLAAVQHVSYQSAPLAVVVNWTSDIRP